MEPADHIRLPDGRALALDDVGDPRGKPVVYLHGTPDSRLARHPDDSIATRMGVRLVAVDRPGFGDSHPHPGAGLASFGEDLRALLDALGIGTVSLLGWSSGGLAALAAATVLGPRVSWLTLVATVPPVEAYRDAGVLDALGPQRRTFVELAEDMTPEALAAQAAPYLVPDDLSPELALEHVLEAAGPLGRSELEAVPGAAQQLARALLATDANGSAGVEGDLVHQFTPGLDLTAVTARVRLVHGAADKVAPPQVGSWLRARLAEATTEVVPSAGHHLLFTHWEQILSPH